MSRRRPACAKLSELEALMSSMEGTVKLWGDQHIDRPHEIGVRESLDAELELWDHPDPGGMLGACGGDLNELQRRLSVVVRSVLLTDRQRALAMMLLARARRRQCAER